MMMMMMMDRIQNGPLARSSANFTDKLENWLSCHNLTESFLIITNLLLLLKSLSNPVAVFSDSKSLVVDYNGVILFSDGFRWCFILINMGVFVGSSVCLIALLLVSKLKIKSKLLECFVITQSILALATLILMARLWFVPFRLELDSEAWKWTIRKYNYQFKLDSNGLWPSGLPLRTQEVLGQENNNSEGFSGHNNLWAYDYGNKVDRLQQALGCCGIRSPNEWRQNEHLGLLAPTCCSNPTRVDIEFPDITLTLSQRENETQPDLVVYNTKQIFYCQWGHANEVPGCQQILDERETNFLFRVRLTLLLLIGILFLNIMSKAFLKFDQPTIDHHHHQTTLIVRMEQSLASQNLPLPPPPTYEQSRRFHAAIMRAPAPPPPPVAGTKNPPDYHHTQRQQQPASRYNSGPFVATIYANVINPGALDTSSGRASACVQCV